MKRAGLSYTALDSVNIKQDQGSNEDRPNADELIENSVIAPTESEAFRLGRAFEKNRSTGLSEDNFLKLVRDIDQSLPSVRRDTNAQISSSVDFVSGQLFERYNVSTASGGKQYVIQERFLRLLDLLQYAEVFVAGRMFERYAKENTRAGLAGHEFQLLFRESPLGVALMLHFRTNPNFLYGTSNEITTSSAAQRKSDFQSNLRELLLGELPTVVMHQNEEKSTNGVGEERQRHPLNEDISLAVIREEIETKKEKLADISHKIASYNTELEAEVSLEIELPEAFSRGKVSMIKDKIKDLKAKRHTLLKTIERLRKQEKFSHELYDLQSAGIRREKHGKQLYQQSEDLRRFYYQDLSPYQAELLLRGGRIPFAMYELQDNLI